MWVALLAFHRAMMAQKCSAVLTGGGRIGTLPRAWPSGDLRGHRFVLAARRIELSSPPRVVLATLLVAAGAIHLAMVPSHASSSSSEGIAFAVVASIQLLLGVLVAQRASWPIFGAVVVVQVAAIGAWMVSRISGLPFGAHAGQAEPASTVDITCVILELVALAVVAAIAFFPQLRADWPGPATLVVSLVPIVVLVVSAAALASPGALDHGHSDAEATTTATTADGHLHPDSNSVVAAVASTPEPLPAPEEPALDAAGVQTLATQLSQARDATALYPTVADAKRAGMYNASSGARVTPTYFVAPFNQRYAVGSGTDFAHPLVYMYAGPSDIAPVVGVAYYQFRTRGPTGFEGPTDKWVPITGLCTTPVVGGGSRLVSIDADMTEQQCTALDGTYAQSVQWMLHAWTAPKWENPSGAFAAVNPRLTCIVNTYRDWIDSTLAAAGSELRDAEAERLEVLGRLVLC
jgi:hypothetical protein